jgi:hypothetical protein
MPTTTPPHALSRSTPSMLVLVTCVSLFGCGACGSTSTQERASEPTPTSETPAEATPATTSVPHDPPPTTTEQRPPSEPAPSVTITTRVDRGEVHVSITNETDDTVSFASRLVLESRDGDAWTANTSRGAFVATLDAEHPLPACAQLVRGASLELSFPALAGDPAPASSAPPGGEHRFVVTGCQGTGRTEGAPFTASP